MLKKFIKIIAIAFVLGTMFQTVSAVDDVVTLPVTDNVTREQALAPDGSFIYNTLVLIPGLGETNDQKTNAVVISPGSLGEYLQIAFNYFIGVAILLAVVMIVYGGVLYATTEAITGKSDAKETIVGAAQGLALALGSYLILVTINPDLIKFQLDIGKLKLQSSTVGGVGAAQKINLGTVGRGSGGTQNGQTFLKTSNSLIVPCPSKLTRFEGKPICPELLSKLKTAASSAGVTLTIGQTFRPNGGKTPSSSSCHQPGQSSPVAGSCADIGFIGRPGLNGEAWGALCKAVGTTPGLFTNNEASSLENCTRYVGPNKFKPGVSTGPHLHVLYTGN